MNSVMDFLLSALPWIAIGLFAAVSFVKINAEKTGMPLCRGFKLIRWVPSVFLLISAFIELSVGSTSKGTTWLVLTVCCTTLNCVDSVRSDKKGSDNSDQS